MKKQVMEIPVYLFSGFLDAGKTRFINSILADGFARDERTVLLCCEEGETAEESARRELLEETGYGGGRWEQFMVTSANPSNHNNRVYTFLAVGVELLDEQHTEPSEDIEVHLFEREQVEALLADDEIMQCLHAAPLWKYMLRNPF